MQQITIVGNQAGQRLDKFLQKYLPNAGTGFLFRMLRKKNITLNGKKALGNEILSVGDTIESYFSEETFQSFSGQNSSQSQINVKSDEYRNAYRKLSHIQIVSEDEHVLILNKPVGILSQKAESTDCSANEWLIGYLLASNQLTGEDLQTFKPSVCNRLDRNTSGLILCGKTLSGSQALSRILKERTVHKYYWTVCNGILKQAQTIKGFLKKDEKRNRVTIVKEIPASDNADLYSPICTVYTPLRTVGEYTLLEIELVTGKPHQIRAHLASIGHPIIGDRKYGNPGTNQYMEKKFGLKHQLLHAYRVVFEKEKGALAQFSEQEIRAELPVQFRKILHALDLEQL